MRNKNLNTEIHRQTLTIEEAAFMLRVGDKTFIRRFVATKKILPVVFDDEQGNEVLFDIDDVRMLSKQARVELPDWFLEKLKNGYSITSILNERKVQLNKVA